MVSFLRTAFFKLPKTMPYIYSILAMSSRHSDPRVTSSVSPLLFLRTLDVRRRDCSLRPCSCQELNCILKRVCKLLVWTHIDGCLRRFRDNHTHHFLQYCVLRHSTSLQSPEHVANVLEKTHSAFQTRTSSLSENVTTWTKPKKYAFTPSLQIRQTDPSIRPKQ